MDASGCCYSETNGRVIADRAIIVNALREEAKHNKTQIKEEKKENAKEKVKAPKAIYQIIPWEYYLSEDYDVVALKDDKGHVHYVLKAGKQNLHGLAVRVFTVC